MPPVAQTPEQMRKRRQMRKQRDNKRRSKDRAAYMRKVHRREYSSGVLVHAGPGYFMGAGKAIGTRWRDGNWDFQLNYHLPA